MFGVAGVDMLPSLFHAGDFGGVVELIEKGGGETFWSGAREHAGNVHVGIAGTGEAEINDADDLVVVVKKDVAEVEVAMDEVLFFGLFDVGVVLIDMLIVMLVI